MKIFKRTLFVILVIFLAGVGYMITRMSPIITGMGAKVLCSCVYATGRSQVSVEKEELQLFPLPLGTYRLEPADSSATGTFLGFKSKAIYRKGLGCTLLAEMTERELRNQSINLPVRPTINTDSLAWPLGDRVSEEKIQGINYAKINSVTDSAFIEVPGQKPANTHAVVILYDGKIIAEKYAAGFDKDSRLMGWSMTKSVTSTLIGILVGQGKLNVGDPPPIPEWKNDDRKEITLNHLLQASSGLDWSETYFMPGHFHNMYIHSDDKGGYAARQKLKHSPGELFEYSSGTTNILSKIIRQTVGDKDYYRFVYDQLFYKIGMYHALLEPDASGTFVGSSYGYASARDWARFGLLFLNDGVWNGQRVLPEGWVTYSYTPAAAARLRQYGAQWWLNAGEPGNVGNRRYPHVPVDAYEAEGFEDQDVLIVPSKKLVVVRLGVTHGKGIDFDKFVAEIISALPE